MRKQSTSFTLIPSLFSGKVCSTCNVWNPYTQFYTSKWGDGYIARCKKCTGDACRIYETANREKVRARSKAWEDRNRERINATNRENRKKDPERFKRTQQKYHQSPQYADLRRATYGRRKARKLGNGGNYTVQEWRDLCSKYGNACLRCGQTKPLTADHVIPLSKGGTSFIENIQPLCLSCNSIKKDKDIDYRLSAALKM